MPWSYTITYAITVLCVGATAALALAGYLTGDVLYPLLIAPVAAVSWIAVGIQLVIHRRSIPRRWRRS